MIVDPAQTPVRPANKARPVPAGRGHQPQADRADHAIKQRVEDGTYGPGHRLVLDQLARELSVSPVPVREAVRRQEGRGATHSPGW
ncbi:MAG: GntR family transcriptional regulator [Pseudonocardia sp.]|nr:GntR family transcriptional regulator [Pseudonocardia sp.]